MPIFEYKCSDCGRSFELLMMGKEVPECPSCGSKNVKKLMSRFSAKTSEGNITGSSCSTCSGGTCSACGK